MDATGASPEGLLRDIERVWSVAELPRRADLCREALSKVSRRKDRRLWAVLQAELANSLLLSPGCDLRGEEEAITAYGEALVAWPRGERTERAEVEIDLALAYAGRRAGAPRENVEKGLRCIWRALRLITQETAPRLWARAWSARGELLAQRETGSSLRHWNQAIEAYRRALQVQSPEAAPRDWSPTMLGLGNALLARSQERPVGDLEEAILTYRQLLAMCDATDSNWVPAQINLAIALSQRDGSGSREEAVKTVRQALAVLSRHRAPEEWAKVQQLLGNLLIESDGADDREEAITAFRRALRVWRREIAPLRWAEISIELAEALVDRTRGNPKRNVERAIRYLRDVLSVLRRGSAVEEWISATTLLGVCLMRRGTGSRALNIEQAIRCFRRVLRAQSAENNPQDVAMTCLELAEAYLDRVRGNKAGNLEIAVNFSRRAVALLSLHTFPLAWAAAQRLLGDCLLDRLRGDRSAHLEEAIDCHRRAAEAFSAQGESYEWALTLNNLGNALRSRIREDRSGSHEEAIDAYEQALTVLNKEADPREWGRTLMGLGVAYSERPLGEPAENLELAVSFLLKALSVRPSETGFDHWADTMLNLGTVYQDPRSPDRARGIELAIETYQRILRSEKRRINPLTWAEATLNLGTAYSDRLVGDPARNIEKAIAAYRRALTVMTRGAHPLDWALLQFNLGEAYERRALGAKEVNLRKATEAYKAALKIHDPWTLPFECRRTAFSLGELCLRTRHWRQAASAFRIALQAAEALYRSSLLASSREAELSAFPEISRHAAYALARVGRTGEALIVLERGRAREIGESLARDRVDIEAIGREDPSLYQRYLRAIRQLQQVERTERSVGHGAWRDLVIRRGLEPLRAEARQARANLDSVVSDIRKLPGREGFLQPLDAFQIAASVQPGSCLAYLNVTAVGSQIYLLLRAGEGHVERKVLWEDGFDAKTLGGLLTHWSLYSPPTTGISPALRSLGALAAPLAFEMRRRGLERAALIPCGALSLFPLHAALYRTESGEANLLDAIEVSYAPSARLLAASEEVLQSKRDGPWQLVGVGDPEVPGELPLLFAGGELSFISRLFPGEQNCLLFGPAAGREALLRNLSGATHLHLACHGYFFEEEPFASCLLLARGEVLSAREMASGGRLTRTRLAVLSACQSARVGVDRLPDEAIGLPSVFLQAGIPGVVGTLWPVDDVSTALLMMRFYDLHLRGDGDGPLPPTRALCRAQLWLRDLGAGELLAFFQESRRVRDAGGPALDAAAIATGLSRFALEDAESRPFDDPWFWAPFVFVGV